VKFKDRLEETCFEIAQKVVPSGATLEHNKVISIEIKDLVQTASFSGPPSKEVDLISVTILESPNLVLLISCKNLSKPVEPAHIQEWANVVRVMNRYADRSTYLGIVVSTNGFTSGCESWATDANIALIPPIKGISQNNSYNLTVKMFDRAIKALIKRIDLEFSDLLDAPKLYDFIHSIIADFEGHTETTKGERFTEYPNGFHSCFADFYQNVSKRIIDDIFTLEDSSSGVRLENENYILVREDGVSFGHNIPLSSTKIDPACYKNMSMDLCSLNFVKNLVTGLKITSAADFGSHIEIGLNNKYNLGVRTDGFYIMWTENPPDQHIL
jgi:hypothetical protein